MVRRSPIELVALALAFGVAEELTRGCDLRTVNAEPVVIGAKPDAEGVGPVPTLNPNAASLLPLTSLWQEPR